MRRGSFSQQPGEEVLALTRRHTFAQYARMALVVALIAVPLALLWYVIVRFGDTGDDSQQWVLVTLSAVWVAYWVFRFVFMRYRYENEVWLITDRRLVHIYRRHWLSGWTNSLPVGDVAQVSLRRPKPFGLLFGYGDVQCWDSDGRLAFVISEVTRPEELRALVQQAQNKQRVQRS